MGIGFGCHFDGSVESFDGVGGLGEFCLSLESVCCCGWGYPCTG